MRSLKHRILIMLLGSLVILSSSFILVLGYYMKDRAVAAAMIKAQADLATCGEIIESKYPGVWSEREGDLYKGPLKISLNNDLVDHLSGLTGDTVTIFLGDTRVATTVRDSNGERAIGSKVSTNIAQKVLKDGQTYVGEANVVGQWYQTGYIPLRAENGNIIGIFYVGISHAYEQEIITRSLITMTVLGLALTIIVALLTWFFLQRVIVNPLHNIVVGTREVATGQLAQKIKVSSAKEIGELEDAFNQMVEQIQSLTGKINLATNTNTNTNTNTKTNTNTNTEDVPIESNINISINKIDGNKATTEQTTDNTFAPEPKPLWKLDSPWFSGEEGLPKGLSKATLSQIVQFLQATRRPISVEEVAEGVKMTRVTVRRYLEFLELRGILKSEQKYGTVGRPVKLFMPF